MSSSDDEVVMVLLAAAGLPVVLVWAAGKVSPAWLVRVGVLVGPQEAVVPVPGLAGLGLDWARLAVVAGILILLGVGVVLLVRLLAAVRVLGRRG